MREPSISAPRDYQLKIFDRIIYIFTFKLTILPQINTLSFKETPTSEIEPGNLNTLTSYMLACAQEQVYNKASSGKMKNKILASLSQQIVVLYSEVAKNAHKLSKVGSVFLIDQNGV